MNRDDRPKNYSTGASIMVFKGNENGNMITKHHLVPSIFAQFIKIVHWQTKISLKVEFYGCGNAYTGSVKRREKCNVSAGIEDGAFLIPSFKASSVRRPVHFSWKSVGLSQSPYVWKPRYQNTYQWIKIHFSSLHNIAAIKTEGNDLDMEWISSFMLKYKMDGQSFKTHKEIGQNTSTIFIGNSADRRTVKNMLQPIITANTIRLLPVSWVKAIALRLELYGCRLLRRNLGCDQALRIGEPDASVNISVSSSMTIYFEPWQGRLHFVNSRRPFWSPLETDPNPWLQVDLGKLLNLTGVATQGAGSTSLLIDGNSFVKSYILAFAEDDGVFTKYVENENTRVFFGNTDSDSIVRRYFASRVQAKYSRLHPLTWNNTVALRMEFYGCGNEHSKWVTQNHQVVRIGCFSSIKQFLPGEKYSSKQTNGFEFCSKKAVMERWSSFAVLQSKYQCHKGPDNNDIQQAEHSYLCQNWTGGGQSGSSDFFIVIAHGNFSTWSHWSNCTESRGIGEKYRSRNCTNPAPLNGGKDCIGPFHETTSCNITKPAEWSNWGPCSTFCGPGVQNRTRSSNYAISNNNSNDIEFKQCNNSECFVLRNWTACAIVNNKCEKARASRKTDCTDPISGKKCYGCIKEIKSCNTSTMVIRYGNWSSCSKTCGEGRKNKKKYCTFYYSSFVDGSNVSSSKTFHISKSCNIRRCPVNGGWGPWSSSLCSQPCGNGTKTRQRQCNRPSPAHGGRNCEGPGTQRLECKLKECPVNGSYTTWGNWSRCSATCGNGTQVRTRNCTNPPPQHGGTCNGDASQVRICLMTICAIPINGGFSSWGNWSLCTLTCGNGTQQRTRNCSNPTPTNGGRNCTGRYTERQNCNTIPCPQIDGNFTAWSSWSTCTLTCGNGTQQRKRTCTNPKPQNGGVNCTGLYRETQNCNTQSCPTHRVDGGFTSWSQWSTCTVTCGSGIQKRMRTCTNPWPANGGSNCTGRFTEMRSCNTRHCPINGNWTDWSDWSYCNKPCGTGDEFKVRTCTNPPAQYGGEDCVGPSNKSRICNPNPCPAAEVSVVARFTKETWNDDLENLQSQASRALKEKMWANIRALYRNDPSVTGIIVHSFRHGSVIANFSIQYQTLNSLKLLTLKDTMQVKGVLSDMPIKMVNISSNKVPTSSPTFTEAKNISSTSLNLKWLPISSSDLHGLSLSSYIIFYREKSQQYTVDKMKSVRPQDTSTVIDGLLKYTDYSLRILATTANGNGIPSDPLDVKTDEDVPSQSPPNFQVVSKNSTYIAVLWNPINPAYHHGIFRGYNLTLTNQKTGKQIALIYSKEKLSSLFNGLDEYTYYDIRVCGFTSKGCGSQSVLIVRTDEDKPSSSPPNTKVLDFISTSSMKLSWQPIPEDDVNGVLKGHRIRYTILKTSGNPLENAKPMIMTVEPHATSVILENLTSYSEYEILLSAFTSAGDGPTSIVVGETCRCPKFMPTNYWPHKPYLTRFKNRTIGGIFPRIIDSMVVSVCGSCSNGHGKTVVDFDYDGRKQPSMKPGLIPMIGGLDQGTGLSFPVNGNKDMTNVYGEYPFVPLVQSPGVVFLAAKKLPGSHVQNLFNSLINCAPLIAMSFLIAYLAGITMWVLDLKSSQAFPTSFLQGAPEGLWWAYITMTTVGYGDRVPKSFLARTFAILWTLYGIVIASMVTSSMTSSLTAVIIHPDKKIYGTKIAAVHKSCEHRLGILMNGIFDENKVYHNLEEVLQALNRREVEGALVDTYVAESETSLFKNSQIKITKTIGRSFGYGFALSGDAVRLENEFRNYYMVNERNILNIIGENVQSGSLKLNSGHSEEDAPVNIFDSSLVIYQQTLAVLGCLLFCAICIGLIWQLYYKKKQLENKVKHINDANITQRKCQKFITEARKLVDEFCRSTRQILTEMKHRHALEQHLIVMKKHQQYRHLKKFLERYRE